MTTVYVLTYALGMFIVLGILAGARAENDDEDRDIQALSDAETDR
jgi:hypothetical protein